MHKHICIYVSVCANHAIGEDPEVPELRQLDKSVIRHVRFGLWNFSETYVGVTNVVPRDGSRSIQNRTFISHYLNRNIRKHNKISIATVIPSA